MFRGEKRHANHCQRARRIARATLAGLLLQSSVPVGNRAGGRDQLAECSWQKAEAVPRCFLSSPGESARSEKTKAAGHRFYLGLPPGARHAPGQVVGASERSTMHLDLSRSQLELTSLHSSPREQLSVHTHWRAEKRWSVAANQRFDLAHGRSNGRLIKLKNDQVGIGGEETTPSRIERLKRLFRNLIKAC